MIHVMLLTQRDSLKQILCYVFVMEQIYIPIFLLQTSRVLFVKSESPLAIQNCLKITVLS